MLLILQFVDWGWVRCAGGFPAENPKPRMPSKPVWFKHGLAGSCQGGLRVMEVSLWMSFFIILGSIHWGTSSKDLKELLSMGRNYWQQRPAPSLPEKRLDNSLRQLRERNFVLACRFLRHGNFASMITCPLVQAHDRQSCALFLFAYACSYTMNTLIAKGTVVLSTSGLRKLILFYYALRFVSIWMYLDAGSRGIPQGRLGLSLHCLRLLCRQFSSCSR